MLNRIPRTEPLDVNVTDPGEFIALSVLQLDLDPPSVGGWGAYLAARGIPIVDDDIGRRAIYRLDARQLITERREAEARHRAAAELHDAQMEEQRLAQLRRGVPAAAIPDGVTPAAAMLQAAKDSQPRRVSPLEHALTNAGAITYHPVGEEDDQS